MWYYCRVTRMLVSYDQFYCTKQDVGLLQGHQNVGELRPRNHYGHIRMRDCRVTRMLVSYDISRCCYYSWESHCRVTRMLVSYDIIICKKPTAETNCRVTRMLVSYDISYYALDVLNKLQGHQNVGELRLLNDQYLFDLVVLQGHQNVGELRPARGWPS